MAEIDLMTKFNRGLILSLVEKNTYEAIQTYRQYISYLHSQKDENSKNELLKTREAFLDKLLKFVLNKENENKIYELIPCYQELIVAYPKDAFLYKNCAKAFFKLEQFDIEFELLKKAYEFDLEDIETIKALILSARNNENLVLSKEFAQKLCEIAPSAENYSVLSDCEYYLYNKKGGVENLKSAILNSEIAIKKEENNPDLLKNLIVLYTNLQNKEKLKELWEKYINKFGLNYVDKFDYAAYLIRNGNFKEGFKLYEERFKRNDVNDKYPKFKKPEYDGKIMKDKTVLVHFEQGFGDVFLFSRYLESLKERVKKIILRIPKNLVEILKRSFPYVEVISIEDTKIEELNFDFHLPIMSFIHVLNLEPKEVKNQGKYLISNKEKTEKFKKEIFNNNKFKIGISYEGNKTGLTSRDIPVDLFAPIAEIEGVEVYSLQFGEVDFTFKNTKIKNLSKYIKTFDDTASLIENLDLVISSDNSIMNLSGALDKKTFCLFNDLPEFRWFDLSGEDVKWYKSVKPYQCKERNDWAPLIEKIKRNIEETVK